MDVDYSIIIPTRTMEGNALLDSLLEALSAQTARPREVHVVAGDKRQGRAINLGVSKTDSEYVSTLDDDSVVDDPKLFEKLLTVFEGDASIGVAGAACEIPEWASPFQKRAMRQIPRSYFPTQKETIDSDMAQHGCLVMPRGLFLEIGGEDASLKRGLDPILRKKVRDAGKRVVVVADTWIYHLLPDSLSALARRFFRNGRGSRYASKRHPERVFELGDGYEGGEFVERRSALFRAFRRFWMLVSAFFAFKWIRLAADAAYLAGIAVETFFPSADDEVPKVRSVGTSELKGRPFKLFVHQVELEEGG
jgi:GT2 family glycosyltransferase